MCFVFNCKILRLYKKDIDLTDMIEVSDDFFIDILIGYEEENNVENNNIFGILNLCNVYRKSPVQY